MNASLKNSILIFLAAAGVFITALISYFSGSPVLPIPEPSSSPAPVTVLPGTGAVQISWDWDLKPLPGVTSTFGDSANIKLSRGETVGLIGKKLDSTCIHGFTDGSFTVQLFEMPTITTTKPSYIGAPVGALYDPLIPRDQICTTGLFWIDLTASATASSGTAQVKVGSAMLNLTVWKMTLSPKPVMPFYVNFGGYGALLGHHLDKNSGVDVQAALTKKYLTLLRSHRIEPYAQSVTVPEPQSDGTLDIDRWKESGGSYRQLVLDGRIAAPMIPSRFVKNLPTYLPAAERTLRQEGITDAWSYVWDEPQPGDIPAVEALAAQVKQLAPSLSTMVTSQPNAGLHSVDHYVGVMAWFGQPSMPGPTQFKPGYWTYEACMAHGCGGPTLALQGSPDLSSVDAPAIHSRVYPLLGYAMGGQALLYYNSMEAYPQQDPWTNLYLFNGNGDGTLLYPGRKGEHGLTEETAIPSIRLKLLRTGMFDVEYAAQAKQAGILGDQLSTLIKGTKDWSKDYGAYQTLRAQLGDLLNSK